MKIKMKMKRMTTVVRKRDMESKITSIKRSKKKKTNIGMGF